MRIPAAEFAAILRANSFLRIERPPELWDLETTGLEPFIRLLGELIAAGLSRNGNDLAGLVLGVANIQVEAGSDGTMPPGAHVGISISGGGSWQDATWRPDTAASVLSPDVTAALRESGSVYAYSRRLGENSGSVTALFPRAVPPTQSQTMAP